MRIAVTGRNGQVARCLAERAAARADVEAVCVGRPELDLAHPETVAPALAAARPDLVVSAAAYTAVDRAEDEPDTAFAINAQGAGAVAAAAAKVGVPVIHLSTDYVFDGTKQAPYTEEDRPAPQSVYGASKLAGEEAVAAANPRHVILRTAWVYSPHGRNFVKTMLRLAETRDEIPVVADQWGNPTSAHDIADGILAIAATLRDRRQPSPYGIYNLAGTGSTSWAGLARHIFAISRAHGGPHAEVREIATSDYPTKAKRPANSRLDAGKLKTDFGWQACEWERMVEDALKSLCQPELRETSTLGERYS